MHGTYEANNAMHDCDLMINVGARFDDRITGKLDEFSPKSKKVHIDIDPSSINKNVKVDLPIIGDVTDVISSTLKTIKKTKPSFMKSNKQKISKWWEQIGKRRSVNSLNYENSSEMSTAVQYSLPIKIFILNNEYMGMVRQWQELLHDKNYSESYTAALPDFVKLAEAYGCVGLRATTPEELDDKIIEMLNTDRPVIFDCRVDKIENCFPMIPSGKPHNEMLLGPNDQKEKKITGKGKTLV